MRRRPLIRRATLCVLLACACDRPPEVGDIEPIDEPADPSVQIPEDEARALEALGYFASAPTDNPEDRGVTLARQPPARELALYGSRHRAEAHLIDGRGRLVRRYADEGADASRSWMHVEPIGGGHVLAITKDRDLTRLDGASNVVWRRRMRAHHDVALHDGRVLALVRERRSYAHRGGEIPILVDGIAVLSAADGSLVRETSLLSLFEAAISRRRLERVRARIADGEPASELARCGGAADVLHANSIAVLHREIPGVAPAGSVLLSLRAISRVAIVDASLERVLFSWGEGELEQQHDATQLANGNLMIFDNGVRRGHSRVIELEPVTGRVVWSFAKEGFFTRLRGGAQALDNGNVLVTESDEGHAFEVTRDGELVWEFWNPDVRGRARPERAVIYRMNRYPAALFEP